MNNNATKEMWNISMQREQGGPVYRKIDGIFWIGLNPGSALLKTYVLISDEAMPITLTLRYRRKKEGERKRAAAFSDST